MAWRTLFLAGIDNSGPEHWQRLWFDRMPGALWVEHADWARPSAGDWVADLDAAAKGEEVLLVAHSLGCLLATEWLRSRPVSAKPVAAFLAAPPDPAAEAFPHHLISGFRPGDACPIGFPTVLVASRNDPYAGFEYSQRCARAWGSVFVDAKERGHLNAASGLGAWPGAWGRWREFLASLPSESI